MRPRKTSPLLTHFALGALLLGIAGCGLGSEGGGEYPFVTLKVAALSLETRYVNVTGDADCRPGPYPVTYRWGAAALEGCFKIPAQCFVGAPSYSVSLLGINDSGVVIQTGTGTVKGTTDILRPPAGPAQTVVLLMTPRTPPAKLNGFRPNEAWPEMTPCQ